MRACIKIIKRFALFLSRDKSENAPEVSEIFIMLVAVITTGLLMWSYALNSYLTVDNIFHLKLMCLIYSLIHIISPFLYLLIPSTVLVTYIFIGAGFTFQFHHALATGGFYSNTIIWFSLLPLIVGVVVGLRHMLVWMLISLLGVFGHYILTTNGIVFDVITPAGKIWAQINIAIGYILVNIALFIVYSDYRARSILSLEKKEKKIRGLFRILVHDISNPLTLILFGYEKLKQGPLNPTQEVHLDRLNRGARTIYNIIETTKKYESVSTQNAKLSLRPTNLRECIETALALLGPIIEKKEIKIELELPNKILVMADANVLTSQVLMNILSNAIKFSPPNSIIEIKEESFIGRDQDHYQVSIQDYGIGIPDELLSTLFDESSCLSRIGTSGEVGTGFGMPIMAMMMEKFNGSVSVKSQTKGKTGTCFTLTFEKARGE